MVERGEAVDITGRKNLPPRFFGVGGDLRVIYKFFKILVITMLILKNTNHI